MSSPRSPRPKPTATPEKRARGQATTLKWIHDCLRARGLSEGRIEALARTYSKWGAGKKLIADAEGELGDRASEIAALLKIEIKAHAALHRLFGEAQQFVDLRAPPRWGGARSRRIDSLRGNPCDLAKQCDAFYPEVRKHAAVCRWLSSQVSIERERKGDPTCRAGGLRAEIAALAPELLDKRSIIAFLVEKVRLSTADVALFMLARGDGVALPIGPDQLKSAAHAISVALSESRPRQIRRKERREP